MKRKLSRLIFFIIMLIFAIDAIKTAINYSDKLAKIEAEKQQTQILLKKNEELKKTLEKITSPRFVEEEARNKLNLSRPGETVIIGE